MNRSTGTLAIWRRLSTNPVGKWLFSRIVCFKAPYFSTISPRFVELRPGYCEVRIPKRRAVLNHLGTVHAIAMCNLAELAGGLMTEVTIPTTHRWIPKGMAVEYLRKATRDVVAVATLDSTPDLSTAGELRVAVNICEVSNSEPVFRAQITMWVSLQG